MAHSDDLQNQKCPECGGVHFAVGLEYEHHDFMCSYQWSDTYQCWIPPQKEKDNGA